MHRTRGRVCHSRHAYGGTAVLPLFLVVKIQVLYVTIECGRCGDTAVCTLVAVCAGSRGSRACVTVRARACVGFTVT